MVSNNVKYNSFDEYYNVVVSKLSTNGIILNKTKFELNELVYVMFYKNIPDTTASILIENFYSIYKKNLK